MKKKEIKAKLANIKQELDNIAAWRKRLKRIAKKLRDQL